MIRQCRIRGYRGRGDCDNSRLYGLRAGERLRRQIHDTRYRITGRWICPRLPLRRGGTINQNLIIGRCGSRYSYSAYLGYRCRCNCSRQITADSRYSGSCKLPHISYIIHRPDQIAMAGSVDVFVSAGTILKNEFVGTRQQPD